MAAVVASSDLNTIIEVICSPRDLETVRAVKASASGTRDRKRKKNRNGRIMVNQILRSFVWDKEDG